MLNHKTMLHRFQRKRHVVHISNPMSIHLQNNENGAKTEKRSKNWLWNWQRKEDPNRSITFITIQILDQLDFSAKLVVNEIFELFPFFIYQLFTWRKQRHNNTYAQLLGVLWVYNKKRKKIRSSKNLKLLLDLDDVIIYLNDERAVFIEITALIFLKLGFPINWTENLSFWFCSSKMSVNSKSKQKSTIKTHMFDYF